MTRHAAVSELDAASYSRSPLHAETFVWLEKNCYIDVWIEVLHALRLDPLAVMPFTLAIDFEGDQWTFFKPPHDELRDLYGLDVQELTVWRPLIEHAVEHLKAGKLISTEADAYWLPDTAGTDYRRQHTKSTIVLNDIDVEARRLGYFHNTGYFVLQGEDFARLFRLDEEADPGFLPLFAEFVRLDRVARFPERELASKSLALLCRHLARRPVLNPLVRFEERLRRELPLLQERGLAEYHRWAFGTIRQLGAAFELAAHNIRWLAALDRLSSAAPADDFESIAVASKALILGVARAVNSRRPTDFGATFKEMASAWERGMHRLSAATAVL